jgi:hypothetical protein
MDIAQLPALPALTDLDQAWTVLEKSKRSALVTEVRSEIRLITALDILLAERIGKKTLRGAGGRALRVLGTPLSDDQSLSVRDRLTTLVQEHVTRNSQLGRSHKRVPHRSPLEQILGGLVAGMSPHELAILGVNIGTALILSGRESDQVGMTPPRRCMCTDPDYFEIHRAPRSAQTGDKCRICGARIECRR